MIEIWKPIVENPAWGDVSNCGRVRNPNGVLRKPVVSEFGYVRMGFQGGKYIRFVHRLVAEAFVLRPEGKQEINHKDCNKLNNWHENLEWVTKKENIHHAYDNDRRPNSHRKAILLPEHRKVIEERIALGHSQRTIAADYGVNQSSINIFLNGRKTTAFQWRNPN